MSHVSTGRWRPLVTTAILSTLLCGPLVGTPALAAPLEGGSARVAAASTPQTFDLKQYLQDSPYFSDAEIDLSGVSGRTKSFRVVSEYSAPVGVHEIYEETLENRTNSDQVLSSRESTTETSTATAFSLAHSIKAGLTLTYQQTTGVAPFTTQTSVSATLEYGVKFENTYTLTTRNSVTFPRQNVTVPAQQAAVVRYTFLTMEYRSTVDVDVELSGRVVFRQCGKETSAPIGEILSRASEFGLPNPPSWIKPTGETALMSTTLDYSNQTTQRWVSVTAATLGDHRAIGAPVENELPATSPTSTHGGGTPLSRDSEFTGGPLCLMKPVDSSALLSSAGKVMDPEWGMTIGAPDGVAMTAVSGARWSGVGASLSAIDSQGRAYWYGKRGSFSQINIGTKALATADGVALLGEDGNVYDAGGGRRISAPGGVRFVSVSGVHHNGDAFYYSAISRDGHAYWSERGNAFSRVDLPTRAVRTLNGAIIVGADGQLYNARTGAAIPNPSGITIASVSAAVEWCSNARTPSPFASYTWGCVFAPTQEWLAQGHNAVAAVVDVDGRLWTSVGGGALTRRDLPGFARAVSTSEGAVGLDADGRVFSVFAPSVATPAGVRFVAVTAGPDSLQWPTISAVASDGRVFWSSWSQPFREVTF